MKLDFHPWWKGTYKQAFLWDKYWILVQDSVLTAVFFGRQEITIQGDLEAHIPVEEPSTRTFGLEVLDPVLGIWWGDWHSFALHLLIFMPFGPYLHVPVGFGVLSHILGENRAEGPYEQWTVPVVKTRAGSVSKAFCALPMCLEGVVWNLAHLMLRLEGWIFESKQFYLLAFSLFFGFRPPLQWHRA